MQAESESDSDLDDSKPARAYRTALKAYKDLRFKLLSEASLLALFLGGVWEIWGDFLLGILGPGPATSPVVWVVALLLLTPCYGDLQDLRKLGNRCNELRKALPSGYKAPRLDWDSEDEAKLTYNVERKLPFEIQTFGLIWVFLMSTILGYNALFPAETDEEMIPRYSTAIYATVRAVGSVILQGIKILALETRKRKYHRVAE